MRIFKFFCLVVSLIISGNSISMEKNLYDITFKDLSDNSINISDYKDKVILVVNVASRCGFTKQYEGLQSTWDKYRDEGLVIIGISSNSFNQELDTSKEVKDFCESKFGITFPMTETVDVKGENAHEFYKWALKSYGKSTIPKWNFYKILINRDGKIVETFSSMTRPTSNNLLKKIEELL